MDSPFTAVELTGTLDDQQRLLFDESLPVSVPQRVRVILLYPQDSDLSEAEWLRSMRHNPAFNGLLDPDEDIYSLADGKPFDDKA